MLLVKTVPEAVVRQRGKVVVAVLLDRFVERDVIVQLAAAVPAAGHAPTTDAVRTLHPALCPKHLAVVIVNTVVEVEDNFLCRPLGEDVAVHTATLCGGELAANVVVVQRDGVVARCGHLGLVAETLAVAPVGVLGGAGVELGLAAVGHNQNISQVAVAGATEMGVAEAHDAAVAVLVTGTVVVDTWLVHPIDVVRYCVSVGTQLHEAIRETGSGEGVPHTVGADKDVDILQGAGAGGCLCTAAVRKAKGHHCQRGRCKEGERGLFHFKAFFSSCKDTQIPRYTNRHGKKRDLRCAFYSISTTFRCYIVSQLEAM